MGHVRLLTERAPTPFCIQSSLLPDSKLEGRSHLKVQTSGCVSGRLQRSPRMNKKESTLPLASLLRIWHRHLKETAIILAACLPWQSALRALLGWMQQKPVNSSSRTYQAEGSPGGEWQSLIPLGWCRDQLPVIRQSCVIHYYHHRHLHGETEGLKSRISLKARKHPTAHTDTDIRGSRSPVARIPWLCREWWLLCPAKGPVFQQTRRFFSFFLTSFLSLTVPSGYIGQKHQESYFWGRGSLFQMENILIKAY